MDDTARLFAALEDSENETARHLLEADPSLANAANSNGQTAFWWAASYGRTEIIQQMLREPIRGILDYWKADNLLHDPLEAAEAYSHHAVIALLEPLYGVNVETDYSEAESDSLSLAKSFAQRVFEYLKGLFFGPPVWRYAISGIAVLAVGLIVAIALFSTTSYDYVNRVIVQGTDEVNIRKAVLLSLAANGLSQLRFEELGKELRSQGWDTFDISMSQSLDEEERLVRAREVRLGRGPDAQNGSIVVVGRSPDNIEISSTMDRLEFSLKSTKIKLKISKKITVFN